jgi:hypothetical protein
MIDLKTLQLRAHAVGKPTFLMAQLAGPRDWFAKDY